MRCHRNRDIMALGGIVGATILVGIFLMSATVSADDSFVDEISVSVDSFCTMSGSGMNSHTAEVPNGTYRVNIGTTTLYALCNDINGFAIYAAGYTGNTIGESDSNKLVGNATIGNIDTGLATSGNTSAWAMKLAIQSDSGNTTGTNAATIDSDTEGTFGQYHTVPNEYVKVAHKNVSTGMDELTGGVSITATYAAYISNTQPAGAYAGQVIYTLVHPSNTPKPIVCNSNATTISEVRCMQDFGNVGSANREAIFASMVPEQQYVVMDKRDGKTYTIAKLKLTDVGENYHLAEQYIDSCWGLEGYDAENCDATIYAQLPSAWKAYVDAYDPNDDVFDETLHPFVYDVWMTQNLDLDLVAGRTYTNEDTDIGYNTSTGTYGTAAWSPSRSTYSTTVTQTTNWCAGGTWISEYEYCEDNSTPESYDPGDLYVDMDYGVNAGLVGDYLDSCVNGPCDETIYEQLPAKWKTLVDSCDTNFQCDMSVLPDAYESTGATYRHLGNYYNYAAAVAINDTSIFYEGGLIEQSICPTGWTIPRGGAGEDSFYALWSQYGWDSSNYQFADINDLTGGPLFFIASGMFDGKLGYVGIQGGLWSSVIEEGGYNAQSASFFVDDRTASPNGAKNQARGYSIRCVARPVADYIDDSGGGGPK